KLIPLALMLLSTQSPIANRRLPIANRRLPIANRRLPIANRRLPIANRQSAVRVIANRQSPIAIRSTPRRSLDRVAQHLEPLGRSREEIVGEARVRHHLRVD